MTNKLEHTPGEWVYRVRPNHRDGSAYYDVENPTYDGPCECGAKHPPGRLIAWLAGGLGDADVIERHPERARHDPATEADAALICLALQAPHDCSVPGCPGPENKRRLEAFEDLLVALKRAQDQLDCWNYRPEMATNDCREGYRCPACLLHADAVGAIAKAEGK